MSTIRRYSRTTALVAATSVIEIGLIIAQGVHL